MYDLLAQIILAGRRNETEGWMNILFVVVLAIFWAVGGIIKAKSRKPKTQDEQQPAHNLARRPPVHSRGQREQLLKQPHRPVESAQRQQHRPGTQQPRMKFADIRAAVQKFAAEAEKAFQVQAVESAPETKISLMKPKIQPDNREVPESTRKSVIQLEDKITPVPAEMPETEYLSELLLDYADPEELRRAILHYEILGRPLSLRDPSGDIIGL